MSKKIVKKSHNKFWFRCLMVIKLEKNSILSPLLLHHGYAIPLLLSPLSAKHETLMFLQPASKTSSVFYISLSSILSYLSPNKEQKICKLRRRQEGPSLPYEETKKKNKDYGFFSSPLSPSVIKDKKNPPVIEAKTPAGN
jgi:hypothetical protein